MFGLKKMKKEIDRLKSSLDDAAMIGEYYKKIYQMLKEKSDKTANSNLIVTLKDNNFPKAVLANLVATHGVDSNDCKNHQRDRDNVMSGIMNAVARGDHSYTYPGRLNAYVIAELQEAGYDMRFECKEGVDSTVVRWDSAYLTP